MMSSIILSLFTISELSSATSRLLLQQTYSQTIATLHPEEIPIDRIDAVPLPVPLPPLSPPPGYEFGAFGQVCPETASAKCNSTADMTSDINGTVLCDRNAECCKCHSIQCGFGAHKCDLARFGTEAAYGVQEIEVAGPAKGTVIHCNGLRSCQMATIRGTNVITVDCDGNRACQYANIVITDPVEHFVLDCGGLSSCNGLKMEINFSGPPPGFQCKHITDPTVEKKVFEITGIECGANDACDLAEIKINNENGCDTVHVQNVECSHRDSCNNAVFDLIGDVEIQTCRCGTTPRTTCNNAVGLDACHRVPI